MPNGKRSMIPIILEAAQLIVFLYRKENYMNGRPMGYSIFLMSKLNSGEHSNSSQSKLSLLGINSDNGS